MNKWYKFLLTEERNFVMSNIMKIYEALDKVPTQNATAEILDMVQPPDFLKFLENNKLINIFKTYEIHGLLGHGIKGMAFALKEPHENYVLKFEIHYHQQGTRPGVDYPQQIASKQEIGKYDPKQVNVLESETVEGASMSITGTAKTIEEPVDFYLSIMSKVQPITYKGTGTGGMTTKEALKDFTFSKAPEFLDVMISIKNGAPMPNLNNWVRDELFYSKFGARLPRDKRNVLTKVAGVLSHKIRNETPKSVSSFIYNIFKDQMEFLSKQQFLDVCREYYDRQLDAMSAGKEFSDFHGGNVGFGPKGIASFDV